LVNRSSWLRNEAIFVLQDKLCVRLAALAGLLLAACTSVGTDLGTPTSGSAAPTTAPERPPDAFYHVPDPLPPSPPGALIRATPIAGSPQVPGSRAWAVLYHSRSLDGHDVAVSGTVLAPPGAAPAGGWPVLAWGHGSSGLAAGDAVLDAARAARQLTGASAGSRVLLVRYSEGEHAAPWGAELAAAYAPELQVVSAAALAPGADLPTLVRLAGDRPAGLASAPMYLVAAWRDAYHLPPSALAVLLPAGRAAVDLVRGSWIQDPAAGPPVAAVRPSDLAKLAPWPGLLDRNTPGHAAAQVPLLIAQGTGDERVAPASNRSLTARLCRAGDRVQLRTYANVNHIGIIDAAGDNLLAWLGQRLASRPAGSNCQH